MARKLRLTHLFAALKLGTAIRKQKDGIKGNIEVKER
jgi:hypothetical protein